MSGTLPKLYYLDGGNFKLLPEWAYFCLTLGQQIAESPRDGARTIVGLAIPTRAFAASLISAGITLAQAYNTAGIVQERIRHIRNQPSGTGVYIRRDDHKIKGIIEDFPEFAGKTRIRIKVAQHDWLIGALDEYAPRITVAETEIHLPKTMPKGQKIAPPTEFLNCILGTSSAHDYMVNSSFTNLMSGKVGALRVETCVAPFFFRRDDRQFVEGTLQEILRVRQFSGANQSFRSQAISASHKTPKEEIGEQEPPVVVFDGAVAFLKHAHMWPNAHQVALLDRTERQFPDAVDLLNQNYAYRCADGPGFPIKIPNSMEMLAYQERK